MKTKTKIVFFIIMGLAGLAVAGVFLYENFTGSTLPTRGGFQADIRVAVPPSLEPWVRDAAKTFTDQNPQITVEIIVLRGLDADQRLGQTGPGTIDAWIAAADFVRDMADGILYEAAGTPVAQTRLIWLAKNNYAGLQDQLDWNTIHAAATDNATWQTLSNGDFQFDAALPSPSNSVEGLAAYISAAANYQQKPNLVGESVTDQDFLTWMDEIWVAVPEKTRAPFEQFSRPPISVDVGLLLESELHALDSSQFITQQPQYNVRLNYPFIIREDSTLENAENRKQAAQAFGDFLLSSEQQQKLANFGFATADDPSFNNSVEIDGTTAEILWGRIR